MAVKRGPGEKHKMAEALWAEGWTCQAIADRLGVSKQYISQMLRAREINYVPIRGVCYPGLNRWLSEHRYGMPKLLDALGYQYSGNAAAYLRQRLQGKHEFHISEIRDILKLTGLTFEEAFALEEDGGHELQTR